MTSEKQRFNIQEKTLHIEPESFHKESNSSQGTWSGRTKAFPGGFEGGAPPTTSSPCDFAPPRRNWVSWRTLSFIFGVSAGVSCTPLLPLSSFGVTAGDGGEGLACCWTRSFIKASFTCMIWLVILTAFSPSCETTDNMLEGPVLAQADESSSRPDMGSPMEVWSSASATWETQFRKQNFSIINGVLRNWLHPPCKQTLFLNQGKVHHHCCVWEKFSTQTFVQHLSWMSASWTSLWLNVSSIVEGEMPWLAASKQQISIYIDLKLEMGNLS